jgi:hypothetical protein
MITQSRAVQIANFLLVSCGWRLFYMVGTAQNSNVEASCNGEISFFH